MKIITLLFFLSGFFTIQAQEYVVITGEVDFPWINGYSAYGLDQERAEEEIAAYESMYQEARQNDNWNAVLCLYEFVKEKNLLYAPYVVISNEQQKICIVYMDSANYEKTGLWNYIYEDLVSKQHFLEFKGRCIYLGENVYWLTEFDQLAELEDLSRSKRSSKFAMDVYRK